MLFLATCFQVSGQDFSVNFSKSEIEDDFTFFKQQFNECHPYPLLNVDSTTYWTTVHENYKKLLHQPVVDRTDLIKFYGHVLAMLKDSHTSLNYTNELFVWHEEKQPVFPYYIIPKPDSSFVLVEEGLETKGNNFRFVYSINNEPIQDVFNRFIPYVTCEIRNKMNLWEEVSSQFVEFMTLLDTAEGDLLFEVSDTKKGLHYIDTIPRLLSSTKELNKLLSKYYLECAFKPKEAYDFDINDNKAIVFPNFFMESPPRWRYYKYDRKIRNLFQKLTKNKVDTLIFDIRDNAGGVMMNEMLLAQHLLSEKLVMASNEYRFDSHVQKSYQLDDFEWSIRGELKKYKQIYVLVNSRTLSASIHFAAELQKLPNVTVIGNVSAYSHINGNVISLKLPQSGLEIDFSTADFRIATRKSEPDYITPDIPFRFDFEDEYHIVGFQRFQLIYKWPQFLKMMNEGRYYW